MYNILALDPAELFGWAVSNEIYGTWNFKLRKDESFSIKLIKFEKELEEIIRLRNINLIAYERPSGFRPSAIMSHAKFVAIIEVYCTKNNIPYKGYSATEIKKFATGKGNAKKNKMIAWAKIKYKYKGHDDNEADALHLLNLAKQDYVSNV